MPRKNFAVEAAISAALAIVARAEPGRCVAAQDERDLEPMIQTALHEDAAQELAQDLDAMRIWMTPAQIRRVEREIKRGVGERAVLADGWDVVVMAG